jgi:plasmid replication initiation protein
MSLSNRNIVKQSYELNNARYSLTAVETDIIMRMIAEVRNEDEDFKPYRFKVSELEKKIGKQLDRRSLKTMALELRRKNLTIDKGTDGFLVTGWVSSFEYFAKTGEMELCFDPKLKPYLLKLQGHFAMSDIRQIFQLSSEYAKRIYTIFKQWEKIGNYTIEVSEWQKLFEVPKSMMIYNRFKEKILEVAKDQINKNTDLHVDYKEIKTGRKITHLVWSIREKPTTKRDQLPKFKAWFLKEFSGYEGLLCELYEGHIFLNDKGYFYDGMNTKRHFDEDEIERIWQQLLDRWEQLKERKKVWESWKEHQEALNTKPLF